MRTLLLASVLVTTSGCQMNQRALEARLVMVELQLAEAMKQADGFNEERRAIEALELEIKSELEALPSARETVAAVEPVPVSRRASTPLPPLPPESLFEGNGGRNFRLRIAETERRVAELEKILGELDQMRAKKRRLEWQRQLIGKLRQPP